MITKMDKVTLLIYHKEYEAFLERLRSVGVVHIEEKKSGAPETEEAQAMLALSNRYARIIKQLEKGGADVAAPAKQGADYAALLDAADGLFAQLEQLRSAQQAVEKDTATIAPWGDFDFSLLEKLSAAGYDVKFFISTAKDFNDEWYDKYNAVVVGEGASKLYFVTVTQSGVPVEIDAEVAKLPTMSLSALKAEADSVVAAIAAKEQAIKDFAAENIATIKAGLALLHKQMEFSTVALSGEKVSGDKLLLLQGWVPREDKAALLEMLDKEAVFYQVTKPKLGDNVPVKFKNNAFTRMYEVLTKMYGMPSGTDFDPTPIVAPFFSLFFAFCMGDAGYGLILILLGFLL